jgi:hypothetical protein
MNRTTRGSAMGLYRLAVTIYHAPNSPPRAMIGAGRRIIIGYLCRGRLCQESTTASV